MKCVSLKLTNFRNISDVEIDFKDKNFLVGENAQGKTNILEGLYYLSLGKSFKTSQEQWLLKMGEMSARVEGKFLNSNGEELKISSVWQNTETGLIKTLQINQNKASKKEFLKQIPSILFTPDEVGLIKTQSINRRALINNVLIKTQIDYLDNLASYNKVLKHRNQLLSLIKQSQVGVEELSSWDEKTAEFGVEVIQARARLVVELNKTINNFWQKLSGEASELKLNYINQAGVESFEDYFRKLRDRHVLDIKITHTSFGPHRDDLEFLIDEQNAIPIASQGQFRLVVLALKLAKGDHIKNILKEAPIYLMDDVFSELDDKKIAYIQDLFEDSQSIFTTTHKNLATNHHAQKIFIKDGVVKELVGHEN